MFRLFRNVAVCAALASLSTALAYADPVTFSFSSATLQSKNSVTGTITIDTTTGLSTGANFTADGFSYTTAGTEYNRSVQGSPSFGAANPTEILFYSGSNEFELEFPTIASLIGYTGGALCTTSSTISSCPAAFFSAQSLDASENFTIATGTNDFLTSGSLVLATPPATPPTVSATPEPSSLVLLATGTLGALGAFRRRLHRER